jgi:hypothetical protein
VVGKRFPEAVRLACVAAGNWRQIDGHYSGKGVDLLALPLPRFLNVIYDWAMNHQSEEDALRWSETLASPLPSSSDEMDGNEIDQLSKL